MAHDVFISYSSQDKNVADAVCAKLESQKIRCWIAPRDVPPGESWAGAIVEAISESKIFVLVFSDGSNKSGQVVREVGEAVDSGIPIVPLRIEDVELSREMRYYIKSIHWLDALTPPIEQHLQKISNSVQALLSIEAEDQPPPAAETVIEAPAEKRWPLPTWAIVLLTLAAIVIIGGVGTWGISKLGSRIREAAPTEAPPPTEISSPTEVAPTEEVFDTASDTTPLPDDAEDWHSLSFMIPNPQLWDVSGDERYTALGQREFNAFAWSTENFEGNLTVSLDLESPVSQSEGCVIVYGRGHEFSYGSLIFCVESEYYQLEKHTRFHEGENFLTYSPSNIDFKGQVYSVTIEIAGDVASMYVNGTKVLSTFFDTEEIEQWGKIGLHKPWVGSEISFSNVRIKSSEDGDQEPSAPVVEAYECELDSGTPANSYPIESPFSAHSIEVDGGMTSPEEWADAACVDSRLHYSINVTNPNFQRIRWWVQNDAQDISFLARVPEELAIRGVFVNYFWPEYTGTWAHSDGVYINIDDEIYDFGKWDEMQWLGDEELDPPGTVDVQAAYRYDGEFYWFEIKRPLNSGDSNDWAFEPGMKVGDNPLDSFMIGIGLEEGDFMRYLQLTLGEP
jgi:hypothetical protein